MANPRDLRWTAFCEQYYEFVVRNNKHPRRPSTDRVENTLSEWAHEQRRMYRGQRKQPLRDDRREALERIPGWSWTPRRGPQPAHDRWESHRQDVIEFYLKTGHYPRLTADDPSERKLAGWVKNQLERLPGRVDEIGVKRIAIINTTPGWPQPRSTAWSNTAANLEAFVREHGRLPRRSSSTADGLRTPEVERERALSMWCANQRRFESAATATKPYPRDRRERLERIPGWRWSVAKRVRQ